MSLDNLFAEICFKKEPKLLYEPIFYILSQGGKRLRPKLVMLCTELFNGDVEKVLPVAASFEMLHNFTLIHDDIMDNAAIRRGKPTVHEKYNNNIAILSGDALAIMALQQIFEADTLLNIKYRIIKLFSKTALEVCEGQQYDLNFETENDVSTESYFEMIKLKTATMLAGCMVAGAVFARASEKNISLIYNIGMSLGIAFQLKDDLLDIYANHEIFGKEKGVDIKDSKKTFLYVQALKTSSKSDKKKLLDLFENSNIDINTKIDEIVAIYEKYNVKQKTENQIEESINTVLEEINKLEGVNLDKKEELILLAKQLINREK